MARGGRTRSDYLSKRGESSYRREHRSLIAQKPPITPALISIVDDDELLCLSLVDLIGSIGYDAQHFTSAQGFLTSSKLVKSDCVIADINMPGMKGPRLLRELRDRGIMTPVILITGLPDKNLEELAISVGAMCLLRKPFPTRLLFDYIEKSLEERPPSDRTRGKPHAQSESL
jgi:FixJ family two-component response regulator